MKVNELRFGNWILEDGDEIEVAYLQTHDSMQDCEGIPLTKEWLAKFGFELKTKSFQTTFTPCGKALCWKDGYCAFVGVTIETSIQHVHQLQNLYFALTGEELTIK